MRIGRVANPFRHTCGNGLGFTGMSQLIAQFQLANGTKVNKYESDDGTISYRYGSEPEKGNAQKGSFISSNVGRSLEQNVAESDSDPSDKSQAQFVVQPKTEKGLDRARENAYPGFEDFAGINPNKVQGGQETMNMIRGWMRNETLNQQIKQDPLLKTRQQEKKALEARAKQVVNDLQDVKNERQAIEVLKEYGIY